MMTTIIEERKKALRAAGWEHDCCNDAYCHYRLLGATTADVVQCGYEGNCEYRMNQKDSE